MKKSIKFIGLAIFLVGCTGIACAQEVNENQSRPEQGEERGVSRENFDPAKMATQMTDRMNESLQLTEDQYKKIYDLYLKELKSRFSAMGNSNGQRPQMGGGRPPMGGGEPPQMGGNMPPQMGEGGGMPPQMGNGDAANAMKENAEKMDKKLKKILTTEQYEKWEAERASLKEQGPQKMCPEGNCQKEKPEAEAEK